MAAGRCPECGQDVAAGQLLRTPAWVEQRKQIKRLVVGSLAFLLLAVAVGVYSQADWPAWLPSNVLLFLGDSPDSRTGKELWNRFRIGKLNPTQADRMLENWVCFPEGLKIRSPQPKDADILVEMAIQSTLPDTGCQVLQSLFEMDGQAVTPRKDSSSELSGWFGTGPAFLGFQLPSLDPGEHTITCSVVIGFSPSGPGVIASGVIMPTFSKRLEAKVEISDRKLDQYVEPVWNSESANAVHSALTVQLRDVIPGKSRTLVLQAWKAPIPVAGRLWIRKEGEQDYALTDWAFVAGAGCERSHSYVGTVPRDLQRIDLRIVPDGKLAFDVGFTKYMGATIEWQGLEPTPGDTVISSTQPQREGRHPDRFIVQEEKGSVPR